MLAPIVIHEAVHLLLPGEAHGLGIWQAVFATDDWERLGNGELKLGAELTSRLRAVFSAQAPATNEGGRRSSSTDQNSTYGIEAGTSHCHEKHTQGFAEGARSDPAQERRGARVKRNKIRPRDVEIAALTVITTTVGCEGSWLLRRARTLRVPGAHHVVRLTSSCNSARSSRCAAGGLNVCPALVHDLVLELRSRTCR